MNLPQPPSTLPRFDPQRDKLQAGQIVVLECSVKEPILKAIRTYRNVLPPTTSMVSFRQRLKDDKVDMKARPCLVMRATKDATLFVPFATFENTPITDLDLHTQHFAVAVGNTPAWRGNGERLSVTPDWPESRLKPVYALAKEVAVERRRFGGQYEHWERDERGNILRDAKGDVVTRSDFEVDLIELNRFRQLMLKIDLEYERLTPGQRAVYNRSWEDAEQRREQTQDERRRPQAGSSRNQNDTSRSNASQRQRREPAPRPQVGGPTSHASGRAAARDAVASRVQTNGSRFAQLSVDDTW